MTSFMNAPLPISAGVGEDRTWLMRIIVRLIEMRRPRRLAMLFWNKSKKVSMSVNINVNYFWLYE